MRKIEVFKSAGVDWLLMRLAVDGPLEHLQAFKSAVEARSGHKPAGEAASDVTLQSAPELPVQCGYLRILEEREDYVIYQLDGLEGKPRELIAPLARRWPMLCFDASVYRMTNPLRLRCPATPIKTLQNSQKAR